jgi:hypothetical protein
MMFLYQILRVERKQKAPAKRGAVGLNRRIGRLEADARRVAILATSSPLRSRSSIRRAAPPDSTGRLEADPTCCRHPGDTIQGSAAIEQGLERAVLLER